MNAHIQKLATKMTFLFGSFTLLVVGCARPVTDVAHEGPSSSYDIFESMSVDNVRALAPEEAKAILVARSAFETRIGVPPDRTTELRFSPHRIVGGWRVGILYVYHSKITGVENESIEPSMPAVFLDDQYHFLRISPGA